MARGLGKAITRAVALVAIGALSATAAQGQAYADAPPRWEKLALTVYVADVAAWSGTDVASVLEQWSPVMPLTLTDSPEADVTLSAAPADEMVGATAYTDMERGLLVGCRVDLSQRLGGQDMTDVLAHELGHCLGLGHTSLAITREPSVMYWMAHGPFFSETVTAGDLDAVRSLYR